MQVELVHQITGATTLDLGSGAITVAGAASVLSMLLTFVALGVTECCARTAAAAEVTCMRECASTEHVAHWARGQNR